MNDWTPTNISAASATGSDHDGFQKPMCKTTTTPNIEKQPDATSTPGSARASAPSPHDDGENLLYLGDLDAWHEQFLTHARYVDNRADTTLRSWRVTYRSSYRRFLLEEMNLSHAAFRARSLSLTTWIAWMRKRGIQPITVNSYWRSLRPFFVFLEREHGVPNPYQGAKAPRFQVGLPRAKSIDDCTRILDAAENYPWSSPYERALAVAVLGTYLYAGLRKSEAFHLRFTDVDLLNGVIHIVRGKGVDGGRDRATRVAPELVPILDRYLRERKRANVTNPEFFAAPRTGQALGDITLRRIIQNVRKASGVLFTAHALRHSFVTALLNRGVPIHVVKDLAGHRQISTTMLYTAVTDPDRLLGLSRLSFRGSSHPRR